MIIKICGITSLEVAKVVETNGANWLGFVFAKSSRQIDPKQARKISKHLSPALKKVGVFVNESVERMERIANLVGLDYIQLHGDEPAETVKQLSRPVIRARSINDLIKHKGFHEVADYYLIDSPGVKYRGGSGKTFDWQQLDKLKIDRSKVILAGGLSPDNIKNAIQTVKPAGVDVSSGVETNGKKDPKKITQFIEKVRNL